MDRSERIKRTQLIIRKRKKLLVNLGLSDCFSFISKKRHPLDCGHAKCFACGYRHKRELTKQEIKFLHQFRNSEFE